MASDDKSTEPTAISEDNDAAEETSSCLNDPNYAIICVFLQKFGSHLKIEHPDFLRLQKMIENTDEVHEELKQFFVRLLRKTRKSVQPDKLDSALAKFCYTYSVQDAWEVERYGYKRSSLAVKLRILKEVLESQFDKNPNFRTIVSAQNATELRSQPLGKDKLGNAYWSTVDDQCNLRIYQEHLDEEIWKVVATNRDEMAKLISCLKGNELVMPSLVGIIDEDSSSNSMPPKVDALGNENGASNGSSNGTEHGNEKEAIANLKIKLNTENGSESTVEQIKSNDNTSSSAKKSTPTGLDDEDDGNTSVMSEIDEFSQAASESSATTIGTKSNETQGSKRITLLSSKPPSHNKLRLRISSKRNLEMDSDTTENGNKRPSMLGSRKNRYQESEEDFESDLSDEELGSEEMSNEDDECGSAIEEPMMLVQGEGSGHANKCENIRFAEDSENEIEEDNGIGEAIEEEVFFVFGEGNGYDCDVGNNDVKATESTTTNEAEITPAVTQSKPMFFFGQAGCLKLSPMRSVVSTPPLNEKKNDSDSVVPETDKSNEDTSNDSNSIALEANSLSKNDDENAATYDQTDKATISNQNQESSLSELCESETKNEPIEIEPENSQPNKLDNDKSEVSNKSIKNEQVLSEPNDDIEAVSESETNKEIIDAEKPSEENKTEVNLSDESTSCINNSHVNVESNDAAALKSDQVQDNEHGSAKNDVEIEMNEEISSNSEIGDNVESEPNKEESTIAEPVVNNESAKSTEKVECNDQISLSESKIEASTVVEDNVLIDEVQTNVPNAENSEPSVSKIETETESELKIQEQIETSPETQPKKDEQLNELVAQESPIAASENVVESLNEPVEKPNEPISEKVESESIESPAQQKPAEENVAINDSNEEQNSQVDDSQQEEDIPDPILEERPSHNETDPRDDDNQSPVSNESVTNEIDETLQPEGSPKESDSVDLKTIESCIILNSEPEKDTLETPNEVLEQVSNEPTTSALTISQEINEKEQTPAETITAEYPGLIKEKRKSIDQIEEPVICKRVYICGEKDLDEVRPEPSTLNETITKPNEIPQKILPVSETLPKVEPVTLKKPIIQNKLVAAVTLAENDKDIVTAENQIQSEIPEQSVSSHDEEKNEIKEQRPDDSSQITQSIPEIVEEKDEPVAITTENKSKTVPKSASPSPKAALSRTRKRRISGEKHRHSSESEIESPLSQDQSSDEEVGGKRIKMRAKVVQKSVRKSIEHKRNVKNADWSSDDNEKPNAKRATGDVLQQTESSVSDVKKESEPIKEDPIKEEPVKEMPVKDEPEQHSDEEQATVPQRRSGRPARKAKKPPPPRATRSKVIEETNQSVKEEDVKQEEKLEEKPAPPTPVVAQPKPEGRRKKRSLMGLDIDEIESVQAATDETPVRQSRRIAQLKIREEAERRKAEEVALHKMKEASEKKKKGSTTAPQTESEEENSESEAKLEKKKKKKKGNKDQPWQTDSDVSSERDEEDNYDHEDHERLPPLGSDHEFSPESDIEDESQIVPTKRARTARKDKTEKKTEEESEEEDVHACQKCSKNDHPEWILLCDKCDKGYHCSCLIPVLFVIPEGEWFCPSCQQEKLIDALEVRLADYDALIKQKEAEEAQRQRLLLNTVNETNILKDTKRDRQRARAQMSGSSDDSSESSTEGSEVENKNESRDRRAKTRQKNRQRKRSESEDSEVSKSSSDDTSDNEPIYKLRKRRQANVSYRFNEYDELINRAIKSEMDEVAGAGNLGRGKDISTIMEADKEEKRLKKLEQQQKERDDDESDEKPLPTKSGKEIASDGSDSEPIRPRLVNRSKSSGRKKKKLNSLDDDSDEADSDDDFNETSSENSSDSEESEDSDSSMDSLVRKRKNKSGRMSTRRSNRERKKRFDADFIDDDSFDEEDNKPLIKKKKKKVDSDFSDFNESSDSSKIDSEDLCDDSTDESDKPWSKSKKPKSKPAPKSNNKSGKNEETDEDRPFKGKTSKKKLRISDDEDEDDVSDADSQEVLPKSRRTRGKKLPYLVDDDFDSSDDGIKPSVKRPDTPPEERAAFIKKQEEIKRMLAEKGEVPEKLLKNPPPSKASLSTIPLQVIQTAKALDVDLKKTAVTHRNGSDNDSNGFDDDLPEDFDPEDMDEDAIAKMMEEEDFAQQQLKLAGETIRNRKNKDSEIPKKLESPAKLSVNTVVMAPVVVPPALVSPLPFPSTLTIPDIPPSMYTSQIQTTNTKITATPKKRGRKIKDDISPALDHAKAARGISEQFLSKEPINPSLSAIQHTSTIPPSKSSPLGLPPPLQHTPGSQIFPPHVSSAIQHTSSVIAHSSVIQQRSLPSILPQSSALGIALNQQPIIPSTILDVQNTRLLDPSELGKPPDNILESPKKRGRRKKVTPLRESISSPPNAAVSPPGVVSSPISIPNVPKITSILSERLSAGPGDKAGLSIATPPQLFSPSSRSQPSVIQRLARPPQQRPPFSSSGSPQVPPQRYFSPNAPLPPHSLPSSVSHSRPTYHAPNVTVSAGHRASPLVPPSHGGGHLPHPMYMRGQHGLYSGYPNIQPPPIHGGSPQNFTGPYQNPFSNYYAAAAAAAERRSGAIMSHTLEPFDNKGSPSTHERMAAYAHSSLTALQSLSTRNPANPPGEADDERHGPGNAPGSSEFSGLVSYFSSQQDDLDS